MKARGNAERRRRDAGDSAGRGAFALGFQDGLGHFLDEQRDAVRALDDVLPNAGRKRLFSRNLVDQGLGLAARRAD